MLNDRDRFARGVTDLRRSTHVRRRCWLAARASAIANQSLAHERLGIGAVRHVARVASPLRFKGS